MIRPAHFLRGESMLSAWEKGSKISQLFCSGFMIVELVEDGPKEVRPAKRRKVEQHDPFRPFRLVPSPQEARGLETSTSLMKQG
jgi:hypothetical protein